MSCLLSEVEINPKWSKNILFSTVRSVSKNLEITKAKVEFTPASAVSHARKQIHPLYDVLGTPWPVAVLLSEQQQRFSPGRLSARRQRFHRALEFPIRHRFSDLA